MDRRTTVVESMDMAMLVANIAGNLMAGGHYGVPEYAVRTAREIVAEARKPPVDETSAGKTVETDAGIGRDRGGW